ncbi:MAG: antibiotic biosynthesis monooxygenase [Thermoleophilaceae bacterium]|nr:antibiotic biosynthesis monooxygenase [Thermoleophilaceae bacterium]
MITRLWRGWTSPDNAEAYERIVSTGVLPTIARRGIDGYRGAYLLRREVGDEVEFATILLFESLEALREFGGEDYEKAYVPPQAREVLSRFDETSAHYETLMTPGDR